MNRYLFTRLRVVLVTLAVAGASTYVVLPNDGCTGGYDMFLPGQPASTVRGFTEDPALQGNDRHGSASRVDGLPGQFDNV